MSLAAAPSAGFGSSQTGPDQFARFESAQRQVDRGAEDRASRVLLKFIDDRHAVAVGAQTCDGEQDEVFEVAEAVK